MSGAARTLLTSLRDTAVTTIKAEEIPYSIQADAEQEARIGAILHEHRGQMDTEIRAVLRPDQQTRFDKLIEQRNRGQGRSPR